MHLRALDAGEEGALDARKVVATQLQPPRAPLAIATNKIEALQKRNKNLVDGAVDGMANGTLRNARRQASFSRRGADKKAAANAAGGGTSKI